MDDNSFPILKKASLRFNFTSIPELPKHYQNDLGNDTLSTERPDPLALHSMIGKGNAYLREQRDVLVLGAKPGYELNYVKR